MKNLKNVSAGTWVRLLLLISVLISNSLSALGISPASGSTPYSIILVISTVLVSLLSYWKNNSFTDAAIEADRLLEELKASEKNK